MILPLILGIGFLLSLAVAYAAFQRGEEARRRAAGPGPRPFRSIGEAVRVAKTRPGGRVLVLFASDDEDSLAALKAVADDATVLALLSAPELPHAIIRSHGEERDVADVLFAKYAQRGLPPVGPACLLLDDAGKTIAAAVDPGPLASWLGPWLSAAGPAAVGPEPGPS